jgi:hypothetical protein
MNTSDRIASSEVEVLPPQFSDFLQTSNRFYDRCSWEVSLRWIDINGIGIQMHLFGRWGELCELAFREGD